MISHLSVLSNKIILEFAQIFTISFFFSRRKNINDINCWSHFWKKCCIFFWSNLKSKMATLVSDWSRHFLLLLQNNYMWSLQSFKSDSKPMMASLASDWPRYFRRFFPKLILYEVSKLARNVPLWLLKKCCYFLECFQIRDGHLDPWYAETFL